MGSCTCPTPDTWATARITMAGLWAWILIILRPMCMPGLQQLWAVGFGDMAALPAMALTCLLSRGTPLTLEAIGWAAKRLFVCRPDRRGRVCPPIIGRLPTGSP